MLIQYIDDKFKVSIDHELMMMWTVGMTVTIIANLFI
jgi:hypothetical protein